jgi:hypothetical protein
MTEAEREAQEQVRDVAQALTRLQERLEEIVRGLPQSPGELDLSDLVDDPDVAAEVRRVVECVLTDRIRPAVDDLLAAADYRTVGTRDEKD